MSQQIIACKVFIGSAGGLDGFRQEFRDVLNQFNQDEALHRGYAFFPMGWELTVGGVGRPQEQINDELRECDYAVFMFRNRWGTPPSLAGKYTSGTEEEWALATEQHDKLKIKAIQGCFFPFIVNKTQDENAQHAKVLEFKAGLEAGKKFFFKSFKTDTEFSAWLRSCLSEWLRQLEKPRAQEVVPKHIEIINNSEPQKTTGGVLPELSFKFSDWNSRAFSAYANNQFEDAIFYWGKASEAAGSPVIAIAKAMVNKGITLGQLNRSEDAIAVYDALIAKFSDSKEAAVQEQVAKAMVNKGFRLGLLNRSDDEIAVYDALIAKFSDSKEAAVQEPVATAMVNKGITLGQLNRSEDAIAVYDALITKFSDSKEAAVQERVANALNCKGFNSLIAAKVCWSDEAERTKQLLHASKLLADAFERNPNSAITIGNQAYVAWLQGIPEVAEEKFKAALAAPVDGGETIYKGTLADLEMHPIDLDTGFKALIERLWNEYTNSKAVD